MRYRRLSFDLPPSAEEELAARLWALGTLGLELRQLDGRLRVDAWFAEPPPAAVVAEGAAWRPAAVELVDSAVVEEADWMAAYRRHARPIRLGSRIVVDPRDRAQPPPEGTRGRLWLHLPARRAFGTGSHPSTRLAAELLEELPVAGRTALDLGTGTGVLAFAALAAGAVRVVALDNDPVAALTAGQNRAPNRLWPAVAAGAIGCLRRERRFDLALVNIQPERVLGDLPELAARLAPGADAIFSGLLATDRRRYEARLEGLGLATVAGRRHDEWAALHARLGG